MSQTSQSGTGGSPAATGSGPNTEKILDAAARCVINVGLQRTTLTDVARTAGLSRMTLYRSYPSVKAILQDLMTREFNGVISDAIDFDFSDPDLKLTRAQLVDFVIATVDGLTANPLFARIVSADPELLLPYITERPGRFQQNAEEVLSLGIQLAIDAGEVRKDDPRRLAASIILSLRGFALVDKSDWSRPRRTKMLDDLRTMFDRLLAPDGGR